MLKSILAASDLSIRSKPAVQRGIQLAKAHEAHLCVLSVVEEDLLGDRMYAEIGRIEGDLTSQVEGLGRPEGCEVAVLSGHAFHTISEEARVRAADLIIMGVHRRQALRDIFIGTTIERVVRTAGRPVLMANSKTGERWRKVLIATDLSESSRHAAQTVQALGLLKNVAVTFVHGYAPVTRQMMTHAGIAAERVQQEAEREFQSARRELGRFMEGLHLGELNFGARIIEGVGADTIVGFIEQAKPDLLVIGTRGLSGVKRLFLGSVAQELMGTVDIDVLAVPPSLEHPTDSPSNARAEQS